MKRGVLCPGFGAQYAGMGKELYDSFRVVQEYFEEASDCSGINFVKLCFASSDEELAEVTNAALSLYLWGAASQALLKDQNVRIDMVGGLDLIGWYSALHGAGAITFPDGLYILRKWSELYQAFAAQNTDEYITITVSDVAIVTMLETLCDRLRAQGHRIAIVRHTPQAVVVSGARESLDMYADIVKREEKDISIEFHMILESPELLLPEDTVAQLLQYLEKVDFHAPQIAIAHPFELNWLTQPQDISSCARALFVRSYRTDFVVRMLQQSDELVSVVPAYMMTSLYKSWLPHYKIWTIDTLSTLEEVRSAWATVQAGEDSV